MSNSGMNQLMWFFFLMGAGAFSGSDVSVLELIANT